MRQFYEVTQAIKNALIEDDNVNTVTLGDSNEVDLAKQSIYPLSHIIPGSVSLNGSTLTMSFDIVFMDIVSDSITDLRDVNDTLHGQNDLQDVWNTQLQVANRLVSRMQRGDLFSDLVQTENGGLEPFKDEYENLLAGWVLSVDVLAPNNDMCITVNSTTLEAPSALTATATGSRIDLAWTDNSTTEDGFRVLRSTNPLTGYTTIASVSADVVAYSDNTPVVDTFYFYKIQAYNSEVTSGFSNIATQYVASGACDDATLTINAATLSTIPSGSSEALTVVDQNANDITSDASVSADNVLQITITPQNTASPIKTGQTTSYATGDDGDLEEGRLTNFTTLDFNNVFGNTNRFTDELGGQTYTNDIVINWATYSEANQTVIGFRRTATSANWATANSGSQSVSIGTYTTGWRLPNFFELILWISPVTNHCLSYSPMNYANTTTSGRLWASTTAEAFNTNYAWNLLNYGNFGVELKTSTRSYLPCRTFTWNGSALT